MVEDLDRWSGSSRSKDVDPQVAEQDGPLAAHAAEAQIVAGALHHVIDHRLGDEAGERVPHPFALDHGEQGADDQHPDRAEDEASERVDDGQDLAVERDLRGDRVGEADAEGDQERRQRAEAHPRQRRDEERPQISRTFNPGDSPSGKPFATVQIAFAWISAPGICPSP